MLCLSLLKSLKMFISKSWSWIQNGSPRSNINQAFDRSFIYLKLNSIKRAIYKWGKIRQLLAIYHWIESHCYPYLSNDVLFPTGNELCGLPLLSCVTGQRHHSPVQSCTYAINGRPSLERAQHLYMQAIQACDLPWRMWNWLVTSSWSVSTTLPLPQWDLLPCWRVWFCFRSRPLIKQSMQNLVGWGVCVLNYKMLGLF